MKEKCGTCRFFDLIENHPAEGEPWGICKRYPPAYTGPPVTMDQPRTIPEMHQLEHVNWNHPPRFDSHWCGEWRPVADA